MYQWINRQLILLNLIYSVLTGKCLQVPVIERVIAYSLSIINETV